MLFFKKPKKSVEEIEFENNLSFLNKEYKWFSTDVKDHATIKVMADLLKRIKTLENK